MGNSNRERVQKLTKQLEEKGYKELAEIFIEIILKSPVYSEQILEPLEFVSGISDVLNGLSPKQLANFISDHQSSERAHKIASQATKIRNALFVSNGVVCLAFNSFERPE
jgi:hypothetical protein